MKQILFFLFFTATVLTTSAQPDTLRYHEGREFTLIGKMHSENHYGRFAKKYKATVRPDIWDLGQNSAGIGIRFRTNATTIKVKWTLNAGTSFPHMAMTGIAGVDLYAMVDGTWQFIQTGRPGSKKQNEYLLLSNGVPVYREYLLNLPLYDGVDSVSIGVNPSAVITKPEQPWLINTKPVVYYGSSIAQGGCASRPGMAFTNILERKLNQPFMNLGFSGQGVFETTVGAAMAEVDAALYVIDCNPNTDKSLIYDRCVELVNQLKKLRPNVPVLLVENFIYDWADFNQEKGNLMAKRKELRKAFETLKKSGVTAIYYQAADGMVGLDHEGTVDGVHPTDLGMLRIADFLLPQIKYILGGD